MMRALVILCALAFGGCILGHAAPGYVRCKGKGMITGSGGGNAAAMYGGGAINNYTLSVDCGDGLEFEQGQAPAPAPTPAK